MPLDPRYPFWVHGLIELPAGLNFLLRPSEQLSSPAPQAHPIIRQYGTLLLSSVIVALIFGTQPISTSSRMSCLLFSLTFSVISNRELAY